MLVKVGWYIEKERLLRSHSKYLIIDGRYEMQGREEWDNSASSQVYIYIYVYICVYITSIHKTTTLRSKCEGWVTEGTSVGCTGGHSQPIVAR